MFVELGLLRGALSQTYWSLVGFRAKGITYVSIGIIWGYSPYSLEVAVFVLGFGLARLKPRV